MSKTAFIFPGQGAQTAGMGKDFYENSRTAKDIFDMASELLSLDMRKLCFEKNDLLDKTEYTQAALVTVSMAAEHVLREWGMTADVTAGLSLGEYCAAASAGAFSTEDAVLMVRKRGIFMEEAVPANKGAMAAVIGLTAARFWDINKGKILLGGEDISKVDPEALLKNFSIVFQEVVLFNTSIKENIRIGKKGATDAEIFEAAKIARCDEFIEKMPNGIETVIGENGERLSGGERQRISIARAILKDAPIILMDEATASLDVENESLIQEALSELIREKTVIVIAHRMRTIRSADKIVLLNNGEIEAIGNDKEMYERSAAYRKMLSDSKIEQTVTVN